MKVRHLILMCLLQQKTMKKYRITYSRLCAAVEEWNKQHGLTRDKKGFMVVRNDGNIHWLAYIFKDGSTATTDYPLADGTLRGCYNLLRLLTPPTN